jgi:hypothetical protein
MRAAASKQSSRALDRAKCWVTLLILPEAKLNRRRADVFRAERMIGRRFLLQPIERLVNLGERFAVLNCLFKSVASSIPLDLNPFGLL